MAKMISFDDEARRGFERGMDKLVDAAKVTLGVPAILNDGVSFASEIEIDDPSERFGTELIRSVARETDDVAGAGATTAMVLTQSLVREALRHVAAGADPVALNRGIQRAAEAVSEALTASARPLISPTDIGSVASFYAGDESVGRLIGEAFRRGSQHSIITVETSDTVDLGLDVEDGIRFEPGLISRYFVTDSERMAAVLDHPYVLVVRDKISKVKDILPILHTVLETGRPLAIIAEDVDGESLSTLVVNKIRGTFSCVAIKAPSLGEPGSDILTDIAVLTGASVIGAAGVSLAGASLDQLGTARTLIATMVDTTIVAGGGSSDRIRLRTDEILTEIDSIEDDDKRAVLRKHLAKLADGISVIKVGAASVAEREVRKHRVEGVVRIVRAGIAEGLLPGGGVALANAAMTAFDGLHLVGDEALGASVVRTALTAPLSQIAVNAGLDGSVVAAKVTTLPTGHGLNAHTGDFVDMLAAGIVEPTKITRVALANAASATTLVLASESATADEPEPAPLPSQSDKSPQKVAEDGSGEKPLSPDDERNRYLVVDMPERISVGLEVSLLVRIRLDQHGDRATILDKFPVAAAGTLVTIVVSAPTLQALDGLEKGLKVPRDADSAPVRFPFVARETGSTGSW